MESRRTDAPQEPARPRRWEGDAGAADVADGAAEAIDEGAADDEEALAARLRASEEKYRTLFESIDEGFCIIEVLFDGAEQPVDYRFLEVNPSFVAQTGLPDAVGRRVRELVPSHEEHWFQIYGQVARTGEALRFESPALALARHFDVYAFRIGEPAQRRVAVLFRDVTDRKEKEDARASVTAALEAAQDRLSRLLARRALFVRARDEGEVAGAIVDALIVVTDADAAALELVDRRSGALRVVDARGLPSWWGERWGALRGAPGGEGAPSVPGEPVVVADLEEVDEGSTPVAAPARALLREAGVRALHSTPLTGQDGAPIGALSIYFRGPRRPSAPVLQLLELFGRQAATLVERVQAGLALEEANRRLVEADRRKNELLAMLSHELRNPLAPIRSSVDVLLQAAPGSDHGRRALVVLDRQVRHLTRLVEDLLDVTRVTTGKLELHLERLDLGELVRRTCDDLRQAFVDRGVDLEVRAEPAAIWVQGDPTRLAQALGNLLQNAAKFTPRGGTTEVIVGADAGGRASVRVADNGRGIAPEVLPHLFAPFIQGDTTLDRQSGGLGLGLALVKRLIEMHGGEVKAESPGSRAGAAFTITLPCEPVDAAARAPRDPGAAAPPRAAGKGPRRRVLLIEDYVDAANVLRALIEHLGHTVEVAQSGPEGLEKARSFGPEVVLCDIGLPGMDGYAVARAFRADPELGRGVTLVALSGYARPEDVDQALAAGFHAHVAKPPRMETLARILAAAGELAPGAP